jgi:hypothetical protein
MLARSTAMHGTVQRFVQSNKLCSFRASMGALGANQEMKKNVIQPGEYIKIAGSYKYSQEDVEQCFREASLEVVNE